MDHEGSKPANMQMIWLSRAQAARQAKTKRSKAGIALYCICCKSYDGARVLEASSRPMEWMTSRWANVVWLKLSNGEGRRMKRMKRMKRGRSTERCANQTMLVWFVDLCVPTRLTR